MECVVINNIDLVHFLFSFYLFLCFKRLDEALGLFKKLDVSITLLLELLLFTQYLNRP